jgi:hypothetical protein
VANPFYTYSGAFIPGTLARAEQVGTEYSAVQAGFALLAYQGVDSGVANAYVVTTNGAPLTSYTDGQIVQFKASASNTGSTTINVNNIGVIPILSSGGQTLAAGAILINVWYTLFFNSTYNGFTLIAPSSQVISTSTISAAAPTNKVGLTAAGGVSLAVVPIDATYAIDQSIAPTWTGAHIFSNAVSFNSTVTFATGLSLTGAANTYTLLLTGNSTTGQSLGLNIKAGTNSSDVAALIQSRAGTTYFQIDGAGNVTVGNPTGGGQGAGTINATGLFVNGVAVLTSVTPVTGANPTAKVALAVVNGVSTNFMRADAAPPLDQTIAPTWTAQHIFTAASSTIVIKNDSGGLAIENTAGTVVASLGTVKNWVGSGSVTDAAFAAQANMFFYTGGLTTSAMEINSVGAISMAAPTGAGLTLTSNGPSGNWAGGFFGNAATGNSYGLVVEAGTNASDIAFLVDNQAVTKNYFEVRGDGKLFGYGPVASGQVDMTPDSSSFTASFHGFTTTPTGTVFFTRAGNMVTMFLPIMTGTSNANTFTMTGIPASLLPNRTQIPIDNALVFQNNGNPDTGGVQVAATGTFAFGQPQVAGNTANWTAANAKGISSAFTFTYLLN